MNITAPIHTKRLEAQSVNTVDGLVGSSENTPVRKLYETKRVQQLDRLVVRTINGLEWDTFARSIFMMNDPQPIKGTLIVNRTMHIGELITTNINQMPVDTFMTIATDQVVDSVLVLSRIQSVAIQANQTNGFNFGNDVVLLHGNKTIESI